MQALSIYPPHRGDREVSTTVPMRELGPMIPLLRARARRFCRDEHESDDLVQETLLRALEGDRAFGSLTHLRAWLMTVLRNVFISRRRRETTRRRSLGQLEGAARATLEMGEPPTPFLTRSLERALASIPSSFASVIRLVDLQDHAYDEAALALGIPVGTVMSRLFRGRRRLAALLEEESRAPAWIANTTRPKQCRSGG